MLKPQQTLPFYLLFAVAGACARTPVDLGYGKDSDALSSDGTGAADGTMVVGAGGAGGYPATGGAGASALERDGCEMRYVDCLERAEPADVCRDVLSSCYDATGLPAMGSAGAGGYPAGTGEAGASGTGRDACEMRYVGCLESGGSAETCRDVLSSCYDATGLPAMGSAGASGMAQDPCEPRYVACQEAREPEEFCRELWSSCLDATGLPATGSAGAGGYPAGMGQAGASGAAQDPCESRYVSCLEAREPVEVCRELWSSCNDATGLPAMGNAGASGLAGAGGRGAAGGTY